MVDISDALSERIAGLIFLFIAGYAGYESMKRRRKKSIEENNIKEQEQKKLN